MARDIPDADLRYVLLGHVNETGLINLSFPVKRFPKTYREKDLYRLPFLCEGKSLPDGFLIRSFLKEHFLKGSQYIEDLFSIPCVTLDPAIVLGKLQNPCPDCQGCGSVTGMAHGIFNGRRGCKSITHTCSFCKGTGVATPEMMERREYGKRLREKRMSEDLSLRELCKKLGFEDYPLYSRIEHGSHDGEIPDVIRQYLDN